LSPGQRADFSVFDRNLITCDPVELLAARTLLTVVDGRTLWRDPHAPFADPEERTR
jgi:predicted amidohydrolase YtcJ